MFYLLMFIDFVYYYLIIINYIIAHPHYRMQQLKE